jgi:alpha-glucosidase
MNSGEARTLDLPLGFLEKGKRYAAHVYSDDPAVKTRTHVRIGRFLVTASRTLKATVTEKGGMAVRIVPAKAGEAFPAYR